MSTIRVYLCDDVAALRLVTRTVLELEPGIEVIGEASDGRTAATEVAALEPDVLVLDLSLPGLDGLEVLEELSTTAPATRIVVFSGYPAEQLRDAALDRGARRYLEKGVDISEVARAVRDVAAEPA
ncbi:MAG: response regulator transcription factor [Actinobacteria bacterium]|nr:response regulator transcription factor [Actinomycetota bacterium]